MRKVRRVEGGRIKLSIRSGRRRIRRTRRRINRSKKRKE
jgi:hypothetical protein